MSDQKLYDELVKLGTTNPELREHIRPVLSAAAPTLLKLVAGLRRDIQTELVDMSNKQRWVSEADVYLGDFALETQDGEEWQVGVQVKGKGAEFYVELQIFREGRPLKTLEVQARHASPYNSAFNAIDYISRHLV